MDNSIVKQENNLATANNEQFKKIAVDYLQSMGVSTNAQQTKQFVELATGFGLNPFKREIYAVKYGNNFNIMVGYEVYIKRAERTGKLNGWSVSYNADTKEATCKINRKDWNNPFEWTVSMDEYNTKQSVWNLKPVTMIKKVAIAQAFRLCFPDELGGMPHISEEIQEQDNMADSVDNSTSKFSQDEKVIRESLLKDLELWGVSVKQITDYKKVTSIDEVDTAYIKHCWDVKNNQLQTQPTETAEPDPTETESPEMALF